MQTQISLGPEKTNAQKIINTMMFARKFALNLVLLGSLLLPSVVKAQDNDDIAVKCQSDDSIDFTIEVEFDNGNRTVAMCDFSYPARPFDDNVFLGGAGGWAAQSGKAFEYLETRTFYVSNGYSPVNIYVKDEKEEGYNCARALYKSEYQDFAMGTGGIDQIAKWWGEDDGEPVHLTIVPFQGDGNCEINSEDAFDTARSIAIWLSSYNGQDADPQDGSTWCDVSSDPKKCLNEPYWGIENVTGNELVLYGTLHNVLSTGNDVNIYVPEGIDLNLPINNVQVRFKITDQNGNLDRCTEFVSDQSADKNCLVDSAELATETTPAKITVSGLGRINGFSAMKRQHEAKWDSGVLYTVKDQSDISQWTDIARFMIDATLLSLSSVSPDGNYEEEGTCWEGKQEKYAIDVSGVEVAWGSRLGQSPIQLNSMYDEKEDASNYCAKMYDLKYVGNWNDQADGPDMMGGGSYSKYTYTHASDDNIKVASDSTLRQESTVLQGSAGSAIILGSYGFTRQNGIKDSLVDGVYVHRSLQNDNPCGNYRNTGGLISTRSCAWNSAGLTDATVTNLHLPALGNNDLGANSVGQPFGIGVDTGSNDCSGSSPVDSYPIANLLFTNFSINVNPSCVSRIYDNAGVVDWGDPSMKFYGSDNGNCDFQGAVEFSNDPRYFVCGAGSEDQAEQNCMTTNGTGSAVNVDYSGIENNKNPNIVYPFCNETSNANVGETNDENNSVEDENLINENNNTEDDSSGVVVGSRNFIEENNNVNENNNVEDDSSGVASGIGWSWGMISLALVLATSMTML